MAARKTKKQSRSSTANEPKAGSAEAPANAPTVSAAKKVGKKSAHRARLAAKKRGRKAGRPRKVAIRKALVRKKAAGQTAKRRGRGQRYSDAERQTILSTAQREGLTAVQVSKRFGVTPVTYYAWRKRSGAARGRGTRIVAAAAAVGGTLGKAVNLADMIRHEIRAHITGLIPEILKSEIGEAMSGLGTRRGRRRD
jgi:hypothetical protein